MTKNKLAFISGATSGIGKSTAEIFAKNGYTLIITGRREDRLKDIQKNIRSAIALAPNNSEIYDVLSELWYEKQKPVTEIRYLAEKAIQLNSKSKNVKPILAWALLQQDQLSQAAALFEEFYDKDPNEVFYTESLAEVYSRSSLPGKTNSYQVKAAELKISNRLKNEIEFFSYFFFFFGIYTEKKSPTKLLIDLNPEFIFRIHS